MSVSTGAARRATRRSLTTRASSAFSLLPTDSLNYLGRCEKAAASNKADFDVSEFSSVAQPAQHFWGDQKI